VHALGRHVAQYLRAVPDLIERPVHLREEDRGPGLVSIRRSRKEPGMVAHVWSHLNVAADELIPWPAARLDVKAACQRMVGDQGW
jgi:hypothetical protein